MGQPTQIAAQTAASKKPATSKIAVGFAVAALVAAAGCTRTADLNQGGVLPTAQNPAPDRLTPAPTSPVRTTTLPPPPTTAVAPPAPQPVTPAPVLPETKVAVVDQSKAQPVTEKALWGAWTVSSGGTNCQLFITGTSWQGGFRAAPRGCGSSEITSVQAWRLNGKKVVLISSSGSEVAGLFRSGQNRYDGTTAGGKAVSFSR